MRLLATLVACMALDLIQGQGCTTNANCDPQVCDKATNMCVECNSDGHCPSGICDLSSHMCIECILNEHCYPLVCRKDTKTCVECNSHSHCLSGHCDTSHSCVGCTRNDDCHPLVCLKDTNICVECNSHGDCPSGHCDQSTYTCIGCTHNSECDPQVCNKETKMCVECNANGNCPEDMMCDVHTHSCVECLKNEHCFPETCDKDTKKCVGDSGLGDANTNTDGDSGRGDANTNTDGDSGHGDANTNTDGHRLPYAVVHALPDSQVAFDGAPCSRDRDCPAGEVCNFKTGTCVQCTQNWNCAPQVCRKDTFTCAECNVHVNCPAGQTCDRDSHTCFTGECTKDNHCPGTGVCDLNNFVCADCTQNVDCFPLVCRKDLKTCAVCNKVFHCDPGDLCNSSHLCENNPCNNPGIWGGYLTNNHMRVSFEECVDRCVMHNKCDNFSYNVPTRYCKHFDGRTKAVDKYLYTWRRFELAGYVQNNCSYADIANDPTFAELEGAFIDEDVLPE